LESKHPTKPKWSGVSLLVTNPAKKVRIKEISEKSYSLVCVVTEDVVLQYEPVASILLGSPGLFLKESLLLDDILEYHDEKSADG
jgi:hypothetical protein